MVKISAFKAIRPSRDKVSLVASRSYLTYSEETIKEKLDHNPYTFLHIINPDYKQKNKKKIPNPFFYFLILYLSLCNILKRQIAEL